MLQWYNFNMKNSNHIKEKAINLRSKGLTFFEISKKLGGIPKSTLSTWLSNLELNNVARLRIVTKGKNQSRKNCKLATEEKRKKRTEYFNSLEFKNSSVSSSIKDVVVSKIALAMLYLGEGGKSGGKVYFGNSNSEIIQTFLSLLRFIYTVDESKFRVTVQCRADQNTRSLEIFWSKVTRIPFKQFYATRIDPRTIGTISKKKEYKGVCRIDYFSADVFNELSVISKLVLRALSSAG